MFAHAYFPARFFAPRYFPPVAAATPSPPGFDPNGVQGSGGGPPGAKRRPILRLDERFRPQIVDPAEYFAKPKPRETRETRKSPDNRQEIAVKSPDLADVGDLAIIPRMPDDLAARLEASIGAAERRKLMAEMAADDEAAMLAIMFAVLS